MEKPGHVRAPMEKMKTKDKEKKENAEELEWRAKKEHEEELRRHKEKMKREDEEKLKEENAKAKSLEEERAKKEKEAEEMQLLAKALKDYNDSINAQLKANIEANEAERLKKTLKDNLNVFLWKDITQIYFYTNSV